MSESEGNNQTAIPTVSELPLYADARSQFENVVHVSAQPPAEQQLQQLAQANQMMFSNSMPVYGGSYGQPVRPIYYKPGRNQPVYFGQQQQQQQFQPQPHFASPVVQNAPFHPAREAYLKESYPTGYVVFHNVFVILLSLIIVTMQILLIFNNAYSSFVGGGCWSGAWLLFTAIFGLSTLGCKSNCTIVSSVVFQFIAVFFAFLGCVVTAALNVTGGTPCWDGYCNKNLVWQLLYYLIGLGVVIMVVCLIFAIFILVRFVRARRQYNAFVNTQYHNSYAQQQQAQGFANPNYGWSQPSRFNNQSQRLA